MKLIQAKTAISAATMLALALSHDAAAQFQSQGQPQWQKYHDAKFGISLDYPQGWDVHVDPHSIVVRSPDNSAFALIENFNQPKDDTAEDYVNSLPRTESQFFPTAHVDEAYTEPAKNGAEKEEAGVGALSFMGSHGPSKARVLTRVFPSGGILFAVAAPYGLLRSASPTLVRIIQSVTFGGSGTASSAGSGGAAAEQGGGIEAAPVGLDSLGPVKYKKWVDPKEAAFSYEVPVGWKVDGGSYRYAPLDVRQSIIVRSPHDEMAFLLGDASLPLFNLPSPNWTRLGYYDGAVQNVVGKPVFFMHFMAAEEFNHWYFENILGKDVDDLEVGETTDHPEDAKKLSDAVNHSSAQGQSVYSIAGTAFTGRSKLNGRKVAGVLFSINSEFIGNAAGDGNWAAHPQIAVWVTGDSKEEARKAYLADVKRHVNISFKFSKEWIADQNRRATQFLAANRAATANALAIGRANMQSMARSHQAYMAHQDDRRTSMMGNFKAQMAAKDNNTRRMQNYSLDQTDVRDSSGQYWKVPSGYSNYYHNGRAGVVVGTNSPTNPGGDFSALTQY